LTDVCDDCSDTDVVVAGESDSNDDGKQVFPQESALKDNAKQKRDAIMHRL